MRRIAFTAFAIAAVAAPLFADELEEQFALFQAEDTVVSASKHAQKASEAPSAIYVITAKEIQSAAALTLGDLLRRVPGFDVYRVNQGYTIIGARGLTTESNNLVLVLLDGREVNIELFGIPFLEQVPVTFDEIERIEVIRGPGSALYGANAFSGVVNIITKKSAATKGTQTTIAAGSFGNTNVQARTAGGEGKFGYQTSARFRRAYKFSDPGQLDVQSASARTLFAYNFAEEATVTVDLAFDNTRTEIFTTLGEMPAELFQTGSRLQYDHGHFRIKFYWNVLDERLNIQDPTLNPPGTPLDRRILTNLNGLANTYDVESQYAFEWETNRLIVGGNVRWNSFASAVLSDTYANEYRFGAFVQDEWRPFEPLVFTAGSRVDYYLFESPRCESGAAPASGVSCVAGLQSVAPALSPRLSAVYSLAENHTLRLSFGRAFRKPAFFERQMQVAALERLNLDFANPDLPNESVIAGEIGYVARVGRVKLNTDLFYNRYENFIIFQPNQVRFDIARDPNGQPEQVNALGGEVGAKFLITEGLDGGASYAYLQKSPNDQADPAHKVTAELSYRTGGFHASAFANYISERQWRISNPEKGNLIVPTTVRETLGNYTVLDVRTGYEIWTNHLEIGIMGLNLLQAHREFPGLASVDADQDPFTPRSQYGGEPIQRLIFVYVDGRF